MIQSFYYLGRLSILDMCRRRRSNIGTCLYDDDVATSTQPRLQIPTLVAHLVRVGRDLGHRRCRLFCPCSLRLLKRRELLGLFSSDKKPVHGCRSDGPDPVAGSGYLGLVRKEAMHQRPKDFSQDRLQSWQAGAQYDDVYLGHRPIGNLHKIPCLVLRVKQLVKPNGA